jgi:hypothetical protein
MVTIAPSTKGAPKGVAKEITMERRVATAHFPNLAMTPEVGDDHGIDLRIVAIAATSRGIAAIGDRNRSGIPAWPVMPTSKTIAMH